jgi:hypothetical protein
MDTLFRDTNIVQPPPPQRTFSLTKSVFGMSPRLDFLVREFDAQEPLMTRIPAVKFPKDISNIVDPFKGMSSIITKFTHAQDAIDAPSMRFTGLGDAFHRTRDLATNLIAQFKKRVPPKYRLRVLGTMMIAIAVGVALLFSLW